MSVALGLCTRKCRWCGGLSSHYTVGVIRPASCIINPEVPVFTICVRRKFKIVVLRAFLGAKSRPLDRQLVSLMHERLHEIELQAAVNRQRISITDPYTPPVRLLMYGQELATAHRLQADITKLAEKADGLQTWLANAQRLGPWCPEHACWVHLCPCYDCIRTL